LFYLNIYILFYLILYWKSHFDSNKKRSGLRENKYHIYSRKTDWACVCVTEGSAASATGWSTAWRACSRRWAPSSTCTTSGPTRTWRRARRRASRCGRSPAGTSASPTPCPSSAAWSPRSWPASPSPPWNSFFDSYFLSCLTLAYFWVQILTKISFFFKVKKIIPEIFSSLIALLNKKKALKSVVSNWRFCTVEN